MEAIILLGIVLGGNETTATPKSSTNSLKIPKGPGGDIVYHVGTPLNPKHILCSNMNPLEIVLGGMEQPARYRESTAWMATYMAGT